MHYNKKHLERLDLRRQLENARKYSQEGSTSGSTRTLILVNIFFSQ